MWRCNGKGMGYRAGIGLMVLVAFLLGGCDFFDVLADFFRFDDHAQAQQDIRIETISISPGSLVILSDTIPSITIHDGTTEYTGFADDTRLSYTPSGGSSQSITLNAEDRLIERPGNSVITIIRTL